MSTGNHALIYGASGITGWAIVNNILQGFPSSDSFAKVTALTNRPLSPEAAQWPKSEKLQVVSGLNLLEGDQSSLEAKMKEKISDISSVTHVYFFAYIMDPAPEKEIAINIDLLQRAVEAAEHLSSKLKFVVLPTGTKAYGVHLIDEFPFKNDLPLKETLPRIPEPHASQMFYYNQLDLLKQMSTGKTWTFIDVVPDVIIGFVPNNNIYCLPQALGLYLSLYRYLNGEGAKVVFPGTMKSWAGKSNDSSQDVLARFAISAGLGTSEQISKIAGRSFNVADSNTPSSWSEKWPKICSYFGLVGIEPSEANGGSGPDPTAYVSENREKWFEVEKKYGLHTGRVGNERSYGGFPHFIMSMFNFDRQIDLSKMHTVYKEEVTTEDAWFKAFDRFRIANIIPKGFAA